MTEKIVDWDIKPQHKQTNKGLSSLAPGLYTYIKSFKMYLKSYSEIVLNIQQMGKVIGLSVDINICPHGVVCPCPDNVYMYKSIKVYTRTRCQVSWSSGFISLTVDYEECHMLWQ